MHSGLVSGIYSTPDPGDLVSMQQLVHIVVLLVYNPSVYVPG